MLAAAVVACRPVDLRHRADDDTPVETPLFQPHLLVIENQRIDLFGYDGDGTAMSVPVDRIRNCTLRDGSFQPRGSAESDLAKLRSRP